LFWAALSKAAECTAAGPGLQQEQLYEGRDLAVTTDFQQALSEAVANHLGNKELAKVFPGVRQEYAERLPQVSGIVPLVYISHRAAVFAALFLCPK
jgi:RNase P/RNase MRP subunit POP5